MSTPFDLRLSPHLHMQMVEHARSALPNECCGLIAGTIGKDGVAIADLFYPLANDLASPTEYESNPLDMFRAVRDMRKRSIEVLAVFHSHPTSPPMPSKKDRERNYSPLVMNLILSLMDGKEELVGWWLDDENHRLARYTIG